MIIFAYSDISLFISHEFVWLKILCEKKKYSSNEIQFAFIGPF